MGRKQIKLSIKDKEYIIEYNRMSVRHIIQFKGDDDIDQVINLIKCGLEMHHANELPSDDEIFGWVMAMGDDIGKFADALHGMIQDVLNTFADDRKNMKWAKVDA